MAAHRAFSAGPWPTYSGAERAALLRRVAARIEAERDELALIETLESGKPISQARDEVSSAAGIWYYAATLAQHAYGDAHNALGENYLAVTVKEPVGVVGIITPWNFPLLIVSQKLPFALAVGCTAVVKPSDMTPGTTTRLVQILHDEGVPNGVVNLVHGGGDVGGWLSGHPGTHMTTFTGSTGVGKMVAAAAAATVKKVEPGAGREEPAGDLPRRRPRRRPGEGRLRCVLQPGRMLQRRLATAGPRRDRRRVHRTHRAAGAGRRTSATRLTPPPRSVR